MAGGTVGLVGPNSDVGMFAQHGSADHIPRGSYLDCMSTPPVTPRTRSPAPDGDNNDCDRENRRSERREPRRRNGSEPLGMAFRINSCERTLREHHNELGAQRIAITQLT